MPDQNSLNDDVHNPVNARLDEKDGRPNLEDAFGGDKTPVDVKPESAEAQAASQEAGLDEFAVNVMAGLNGVGIDVEDDQPQHSKGEPRFETSTSHDTMQVDAEADATEFETYFSGWNGPDEDNPEQETAPVQAAPEPAVTHAVREQHAFTPQREAEPDDFGSMHDDFDPNEKHDALADAVQAALLSVYGGQISNSSQPGMQLAGMNGIEVQTPAEPEYAASEDGLSPQDVILNYFDYEVEVAVPPGRGFAHPFADSQQAAQSLSASTRRVANAAQPQRAEMDYRPAPIEVRPAVGTTEAATEATKRYEGPPAFQPPATIESAKTRTAAQSRESGRLLGAAGIGLIGGIAIAATLAVFFINSYGPVPSVDDKSSKPAPDLRRQNASRGSPAEPDAKGASQPAGFVTANDVTGPSGQPIALAIVAQSPSPPEQTLVSITSVPEGVRLSVGVDAGGGNWLLPPKRLNGLTLTAPSDRTASFELEAQLLDSNTRAPLSEKKQFLVGLEKSAPEAIAPDTSRSALLSIPAETPPASPGVPVPTSSVRELNTASVSSFPAFNTQTTPAETLPQEAAGIPAPAKPQTERSGSAAIIVTPTRDGNFPTPPAVLVPSSTAPVQVAEMEDLIREGNKRMRDGDIVQARSLYSRAVGNGDADAALAMGRSFDPIYFERLDKKNAEPDAGKAFEWYKQAMDRGAAQTAKMRIDNLKQYLNK